ncbi:MAG: ABC transporter permease [Microbacterium sp.]|uniref:ABC transporter permease n=1 Tax=Microbacterium sp. TaxID=51671 RepID=UPI003F81A3B4
MGSTVSRARQHRQHHYWSSIRRVAIPALAVVAFLVIYQFAVAGVIVSETFLPRIPAIGSALAQSAGSGALLRGLISTLVIALGGFALGAIPALVLGLLSGRNAYVYNGLLFGVDFLRTLPTIALIPLVVIMWGPTDTSRVFLVAFTVFWPIYLQTLYGVRDVNPVAIETARSYGMSSSAILLRVVFPSAAGYIATALRIFVVVSVLVSISSELILGGGIGLGGMLSGYAQVGNYPAVYGMVLVMGMTGYLVVFVIGQLERRLLFWHESQRGQED